MSEKEFKRLKNQLQLINEVVSDDVYNLGNQFFEQIISKLNKTLGADYTFIGELNESKTQINTIALVSKNGIEDNFTYDLKHTPCENVVGQFACSYEHNVTKLFPKDQLLIDMNIDAYVGVPLYDSKTNPTGILVCLFENKIEDSFAIESILMIFASRASAELEHKKLYDELEKNKKELESKVIERTKEIEEKNTKLKKTLNELKAAQSKLFESEKMASLGVLTAGVAHEINNPLNFILSSYTGLKSFLEETNAINKDVATLLEGINVGVKRTSQIVNSLNQFSRSDNNFDAICDIHSILDNCLIMLKNSLKNAVLIEKNYTSSEILINCNQGKLHQVFLNILQNAIHAVNGNGKISIETLINNAELIIKISDNGVGISKKNLKQILNPFFTTKEVGEGIGLGLSITYSIIKEHNGNIEFISEENNGTQVIITLPIDNKNE